MKTRRLHILGTFALIPCLALLGSACGTEEKKDDTTKDSGSGGTDATDAGADTVADTAAPKDAGKPDTGPKDAGKPKDTAKPKKGCSAALNCLLSCSSATGTCANKCQENLADGVADTLKAIVDCRAKECADAKGDVAGVSCAIDKCLDKYDACLTFGSGASNCLDTSICAAGCVLGDLDCTIDCLGQGDKDIAAKAASLKVCADDKCASGEAVAMPGCVTDSCADDVKACADGTNFDCAQLSSCVAKCPPNKKIEPNHCSTYCRVYSQEKALDILDKYDACKEACNLVTNPVGCVLDKCSKEQNACYIDVGSENCQTVYDCVVKDCQGIGGDTACITKCIKKGSASAQDAFLHWEGCVLLNLNRDEAQTVGCAFPYDQQTCINYISNHFCGNKASHCFTSN